MVEKNREFPRIILKLQALHRRLPKHHLKIPIIIEELGKRLAGYKGEKAIDYFLSLLDSKEYFILHGIRLKCLNSYFQMDTLLISKKFVLIIEVKNYAGTIYFDSIFNQTIQLKDGEESALPDPTIQAQRQESQLKRWFQKNGLPHIPIFSIVVMSNDKTILKTSPENKRLQLIVLHRHLLPIKIQKLEDSIRKDSIQEKELKKIIRLLKKKHIEADPCILERLKIRKDEVLTGVICDSCEYRPLQKRKGSWFCPRCKEKNRDSHIRALKDYQLLLHPTIKNGEAMKFLGIESKYVVSRLLQSLNLPTTGTKKGTKYILSFNEKSKQKTRQ